MRTCTKTSRVVGMEEVEGRAECQGASTQISWQFSWTLQHWAKSRAMATLRQIQGKTDLLSAYHLLNTSRTTLSESNQAIFFPICRGQLWGRFFFVFFFFMFLSENLPRGRRIWLLTNWNRKWPRRSRDFIKNRGNFYKDMTFYLYYYYEINSNINQSRNGNYRMTLLNMFLLRIKWNKSEKDEKNQ